MNCSNKEIVLADCMAVLLDLEVTLTLVLLNKLNCQTLVIFSQSDYMYLNRIVATSSHTL